MNIFSRIGRWLDGDETNYFGAGPFKPLKRDHPFQRAAFLHDWSFERAHAGKAEETRAEADAKLFWRMALLSMAEQDPKKRCEMLMDVCRYWPFARIFGKVFWEGKE